jgi:hypothetical protein
VCQAMVGLQGWLEAELPILSSRGCVARGVSLHRGMDYGFEEKAGLIRWRLTGMVLPHAAHCGMFRRRRGLVRAGTLGCNVLGGEVPIGERRRQLLTNLEFVISRAVLRESPLQSRMS